MPTARTKSEPEVLATDWLASPPATITSTGSETDLLTALDAWTVRRWLTGGTSIVQLASTSPSLGSVKILRPSGAGRPSRSSRRVVTGWSPTLLATALTSTFLAFNSTLATVGVVIDTLGGKMRATSVCLVLCPLAALASAKALSMLPASNSRLMTSGRYRVLRNWDAG